MRGIDRYLPALAALMAAIAAALLLAVLDASERARIEQEQRVLVAQNLSSMRAKVEGVLNSVVSSARGLAAALIANPKLPQDAKNRMLAELMLYNPNIRNMAISEGTVITEVFPLHGNEQFIV